MKSPSLKTDRSHLGEISEGEGQRVWGKGCGRLKGFGGSSQREGHPERRMRSLIALTGKVGVFDSFVDVTRPGGHDWDGLVRGEYS